MPARIVKQDGRRVDAELPRTAAPTDTTDASAPKDAALGPEKE
jgi:hypothetical protein